MRSKISWFMCYSMSVFVEGSHMCKQANVRLVIWLSPVSVSWLLNNQEIEGWITVYHHLQHFMQMKFPDVEHNWLIKIAIPLIELNLHKCKL